MRTRHRSECLLAGGEWKSRSGQSGGPAGVSSFLIKQFLSIKPAHWRRRGRGKAQRKKKRKNSDNLVIAPFNLLSVRLLAQFIWEVKLLVHLLNHTSMEVSLGSKDQLMEQGGNMQVACACIPPWTCGHIRQARTPAFDSSPCLSV